MPTKLKRIDKAVREVKRRDVEQGGGYWGGVLTTGTLTPNEARLLREEWYKNHAEPSRLVVLEGGMKAQPVWRRDGEVQYGPAPVRQSPMVGELEPLKPVDRALPAAVTEELARIPELDLRRADRLGLT
jgi:hypothetical protein